MSGFQSQVLPLQWVLKYDPATIGLVYRRHSKERKKHLYEIRLNNLIFLTNPEDIAEQLIYEHPQYLQHVKRSQIIRLLQLLLEYKDRRLQEMADFVNQEQDYEDYSDEPVHKNHSF